MSKTEIVKSLNDCGPQLQILQSLRELQSQTRELATLPQELTSLQDLARSLAEDMKSLPPAVADQVGPMLQELERITAMMDQSMEAQRQTFADIAAAYAGTWKQQLAEIAQQKMALSGQLSELADMLLKAEGQQEQAVKVAKAMQAAPGKIAEAMDEWKRYEASKRPWRLVLAAAVLAAILATALHPVGTLISRVLPSDEAQVLAQEGRAFRGLWEKASPSERDLLKKISER